MSGFNVDRSSDSVASQTKVGDDGDKGRGLHFEDWSGRRRIGWAERGLGGERFE